MPPGKQIRRVDTLFMKELSILAGFRWIDDDEKVLVSVGAIDSPNLTNEQDFVATSYTLELNERLVGMKSYVGAAGVPFLC